MSALPITFDALRRDKRVKGFPFQVAEYLHRFTKRCYDESFTATRTIAAYFGVDDRTVQRALKCLSLAGYLVVIRDHTLNSRHRIRMFWRAAVATVFPSLRPAAQDPFVAPIASENGNVDASPTAEMSPSNAPPLKVSEDDYMGGRTDCPGAGDPACGHPAPEEAESSSSPILGSLPPEDEEPEPEKVAPEAIAELVEDAVPVLGTGPAAEGRIRAWLQSYGLPTLRKALEVTKAKLAGGGLRSTPVAYVVGTLKTIRAEGGPIEAPAPPPRLTEEEEDRLFTQRILALQAHRGLSP